MNILLALIAFAVTMIVLSTLVVAIVEVIHEMRGMRKRHLAYLVGAVFDEFLWPNFSDKLSDNGRSARDVGAPEEEVPLEPRAWSERQFKNMVSLSANKLTFGKNGPTLALPSWWWVAAIVSIALLYLFDLLVLALLVVAVLAYFMDAAKEPDRFNFPGLPIDDPERLDKLRKLYRRMALRAKPAEKRSDKENTELTELESNTTLDDEALLKDYRKLVKRRQFITEIVKISKSVAANPAASRAAFATKLSPTDFAAQLARTEFGAAIRDAAGEKLETVLQETARRFDAIGKDTAETFRARSRRWSVAAAFGLAIAANVDAITLIDTYYRNPTLAEQVEKTYAARLDEMEKTLTAKEKEKDAEDAEDAKKSEVEKDIEKLKEDISALTENVRGEIQGLADLGVPIGWARFPYCLTESFEGLDTACKSVMESQLRRLEARVEDLEKEKRSGETPKTDKELMLIEGTLKRLNSTIDLLKEGKGQIKREDGRHALSFGSYLATFTPEEPKAGDGKETSDEQGKSKVREAINSAIALLGSAVQGAVDRIRSHFEATVLWLETRQDNGLSRWLAGVLLGGALIGLGGPFWFNVYRRLSAVASVARSLGVTAKPAPSSKQAPAEDPKDPEAAHQPNDVVDAFTTALSAQDTLDKARKDDLMLAAELSDERPKDSRPRPELTPDGDTAS